jgi:hypothetical protein
MKPQLGFSVFVSSLLEDKYVLVFLTNLTDTSIHPQTHKLTNTSIDPQNPSIIAFQN